MTEATDTPQETGASVPEMTVVRRKRMRVSLVWLVPIAALVVGLILVVRALPSVGP